MVSRSINEPVDDGDRYRELEESLAGERPSRKRQLRQARRQNRRQVVVSGTPTAKPDPARMSRALMAAQRSFAQAAAEARAQDELKGDLAGDGEGVTHDDA